MPSMGLGSKFTLRVTGRPGGPEAEELCQPLPSSQPTCCGSCQSGSASSLLTAREMKPLHDRKRGSSLKCDPDLKTSPCARLSSPPGWRVLEEKQKAAPAPCALTRHTASPPRGRRGSRGPERGRGDWKAPRTPSAQAPEAQGPAGARRVRSSAPAEALSECQTRLCLLCLSP